MYNNCETIKYKTNLVYVLQILQWKMQSHLNPLWTGRQLKSRTEGTNTNGNYNVVVQKHFT